MTTRCDVEDFATHGEVNGFAVLTVVGKESGRSERLECWRRRLLFSHDFRAGPEAVVGNKSKDGEEEEEKVGGFHNCAEWD